MNLDPATYQKLSFQYGPERAYAISKGADEAANMDLAAWERVIRHGRPEGSFTIDRETLKRDVLTIIDGGRG